LTQKRALPVGSTGDAAKIWQVPFCVRASVKGRETRLCSMLDAAKASMPLGEVKTCPDWVLPNDGYDGYYRASLSGPISLIDVYKKAGTKLSVPERVGMLGDVHFGLCDDAGFDVLGTAFKVGKHGPGSVERLAPRRHPPHDAGPVGELCRVGAGPRSNTGRVAGRHRGLPPLAAGVSPHGDTLAGPGDEFGPLGQRPGDERLEHGAHSQPLFPFGFAGRVHTMPKCSASASADAK
jgi:hypothetical protein